MALPIETSAGGRGGGEMQQKLRSLFHCVLSGYRADVSHAGRAGGLGRRTDDAAARKRSRAFPDHQPPLERRDNCHLGS